MPLTSLQPISISCISNHAFVWGLLVTLHSICSSCRPKSNLLFNIIDLGLTKEDIKQIPQMLSQFKLHEIQVHFIKLESVFDAEFPRWRGFGGVYARLILQDLLKEQEYTIYTDCDVLWQRDISELWRLRGDAATLWAVPDGGGDLKYSSGTRRAKDFLTLGINIRPNEYFCSGLLLMNLKRLREEEFTIAWKALAKHPPISLDFPDQDILNILQPSPRTHLLPPIWGVFACGISHPSQLNKSVIHYAAYTPWKRGVSYIGMLWWDYFFHFIGFRLFGVRAIPLTLRYALYNLHYRFLRTRTGQILLTLLSVCFNRKLKGKYHQRLFPFDK